MIEEVVDIKVVVRVGVKVVVRADTKKETVIDLQDLISPQVYYLATLRNNKESKDAG